jgi:class 3 adenylate cyclase
VGREFQLVFRVAEGAVVRRFDQARVLLGRSMVCDLAFDSPHLSRKHAEIVCDADGWIVRDLRSRQGVAVNGRRVEAEKLAHGDWIALAPDAAGPTLLEFRLPEYAEQLPPQAILSDETGPASVVASIDVRELSKALGQSGRGKRSTIEIHPSEAATKILTAPDAPGGALFDGPSQLPVLSMFKSAGEVLLAHEGLDEMLQQVVDLIAEHLPGRRGAVCMIDQASGEIRPHCFSQEQGARSGEQGAASREQGAASWEQGAGSGKQGAGKKPGEGTRPREQERPEPGAYPLDSPYSFRSPLPAPRSPPPFLISRSILQEAVRVQRAMLVASVADDPRFDAAASIQQMGIRSAICVPLYHQGQVAGVIYVDSQGDAGPLRSRDLEVLTVLGLMVASGIAQIALRGDVARERTMRQRLARYNSPQVVEQIMKLTPRQEGEMLADEYEVSVLFADLTGFSALAESWSAAETVRVLNLVFERWTANVFQRDGTLDKYIGDAVMAVFGAPLRQGDHALRAVATALAMQQTLDDLNRSRPGEPPLQLRVGINTGRVIAGDIGSPLHKAYTVIGDAVNIASRLETSVALPGQIVIGQATYEQAREQYVCQPLGEIQLRGKRHAIRAYRVVGQAAKP